MKDYKKILEGVVDIINTTEKSDIGFTNICTYIGEKCPELKESDDKKWRKWLIGHLEGYINQTDDKYAEVCKKAIAWLEKQGNLVEYYEDKLDRCTCENFDKGYKAALKDTFEAKEVDLEKEIRDYIRAIPHAKTGIPNGWRYDWQEDKVIEIAKHFFELGLKAKGE